MTLTKEEARNGWTSAKLEAFLAEAEKFTASRVFGVMDRSKRRTVIESVRSGHFNPKQWHKAGNRYR